jgi:TPP-dependent pyruvate/acetoin dehydrogenase alpha subunit
MTDKPRLDRGHAQQLYREMLRIRRFEAKCVEMYQAQKIRGFLHLYDGQEAIAVGVMQALEPRDAVVATYRDHGQAIARGVPTGPIMAEMFGRLEGTSRGRGGSEIQASTRKRPVSSRNFCGIVVPGIRISPDQGERPLRAMLCTFSRRDPNAD